MGKARLATRVVLFDTNIYRLDARGGNDGLTPADIEALRDARSRGRAEVVFSPGNMDEIAVMYRKEPEEMARRFTLALEVCSGRIPKDHETIAREESQLLAAERVGIDVWMVPGIADHFRRTWRALAKGGVRERDALLSHARTRTEMKKRWNSTASEAKRGIAEAIARARGLEEEKTFSKFLEILCLPDGLAEEIAEHLAEHLGGIPGRGRRIVQQQAARPGTWSFLSIYFSYLYQYHIEKECRHEWSDFDDAYFFGPLIPYVDVFVTCDPRFRTVLGRIPDLDTKVVDLVGFREMCGGWTR